MDNPAHNPANNPVNNPVNNPLRVLFIEDMEDDMLLELNELQQAGYTVDYVRVQDATALRTALQDTWDLVLSDYNMPSFTGLDALKIIHEHGLDIPFILVSGAIGEAIAVNMMKAGAHDYILKGHMARLAPAIQRELKEAHNRREHRNSQAALQTSELRLRTLLDTAADAIIITNPDGEIQSINPATNSMFIYSTHELIGQDIKHLIPKTNYNHRAHTMQHGTNGDEHHITGINHELHGQRKDGSNFPIDLSVSVMEVQGEKLYTNIIRDITERKQAETALLRSEARFRATFEQAAVGIAHVGLDGHWLQVNNRLCEIVGYTQTELLEITFQEITHPEDLQTDLALVNELLAGERRHYALEKRYLRKDGNITWIQLTVALVRNNHNHPDYFISVVEDINVRKQAEARILTTLTEKDTVLRELHHRVKNNMQVISSLLSLQARYANIDNPQQALQESRQRIRAMALIHERLYGSLNLAAIEFIDYLRYLSERLTRLYHKPDNNIKIQVSGEPLQLPVDQALPCALISNELMTNAIRHAYPDTQRDHLIEIHIANLSINQTQIIFRDYGRGINTDINHNEAGTLGMVIVQALTRQLGGTIQFESLNGTVATLTFPLTHRHL